MKNTCHFKNSSGFSLIEVLIAVGIMAIISAVISQMLVNAAMQERSLQVKQAGRDFHDEIAELINEDGCGISTYKERSTGGTTYTSVDGSFKIEGTGLTPTDGLSYTSGSDANTFDLTLKGSGIWANEVKETSTFDNEKVKIKSIKLMPYTSIDDGSSTTPTYDRIDEEASDTNEDTDYYRAQIEITYTGKIGDHDSVERRSRHPVILTVTNKTTPTTESYISGCHSSASIISAEEICGTIDGHLWNKSELTCESTNDTETATDEASDLLNTTNAGNVSCNYWKSASKCTIYKSK